MINQKNMSTPKTAGEAAYSTTDSNILFSNMHRDFQTSWERAAQAAIEWHESQKPKVRLCIECKRYISEYCNHARVNPVNGLGYSNYVRAYDARTSQIDPCGPDGKLWEAK